MTAEEPPPGAEAAEVAPTEVGAPWVLVAEDDADMRNLIERALAGGGFRVSSATDGAGLLALLERARARGVTPAAVVSDVRMAGLCVMQVIATARAWGWSMPILLLTAFASEALMAQAIRAGATAVLSKPFDLEDLRLLLRSVATPSAAAASV